jgi:hypothetical protein
MKGTFPIITCDHEDGCDQWTLDWYSALASNWRELMAPGWDYNPYATAEDQLCPEHADIAVTPDRIAARRRDA